MNKIILTFFLILLGFSLRAQELNKDIINQFEASNKDLVNNNFERALTGYQAIEKEGIVSQGLYTNIGTTYFKLNHLGKSLLYFEKGILIAPLDTELNFNKNKVLDKLDKTVSSNNLTIDNKRTVFLNIANILSITLIVLMVFSCLLYFIYFKFQLPTNKLLNSTFFKFVFTVSFILILISLVIVKTYQSKTYGVNTANLTNLNLGPSPYSKVIDSLSEGYKAEVIKKYDNWFEIKDAQGRIGWVNSKEFEEIK